MERCTVLYFNYLEGWIEGKTRTGKRFAVFSNNTGITVMLYFVYSQAPNVVRVRDEDALEMLQSFYNFTGSFEVKQGILSKSEKAHVRAA